MENFKRRMGELEMELNSPDLATEAVEDNYLELKKELRGIRMMVDTFEMGSEFETNITNIQGMS